MVKRKAKLTGRQGAAAIWTQKRTLGLTRHWLAWSNLFWVVLVGLPWLAPVLMRIGASGPARGIYFFYSYLCHQFANRSFFLFGQKSMYSYSELQSVAPDADTWLGLRAFVGTAELGYKVAWSDRMVSLYGGLLLGGLIFALVRQRTTRPRWGVLALMTVPIVLDGLTHMIADVPGVGQGFRYDNAWLAVLTADAFPRSFYVGNSLGSFNSWMRLISGLSFGLAVVWLAYPSLETYFCDIRQTLEPRLRQIDVSVARPPS